MNNGEGVPLSAECCSYLRSLQSGALLKEKTHSAQAVKGDASAAAALAEACDEVLLVGKVEQISDLVLKIQAASKDKAALDTAAMLLDRCLSRSLSWAADRTLDPSLEEPVTLLFHEIFLCVHSAHGSQTWPLPASWEDTLSDAIMPRLSIYTAGGQYPRNAACLRLLLDVIELTGHRVDFCKTAGCLSLLQLCVPQDTTSKVDDVQLKGLAALSAALLGGAEKCPLETTHVASLVRIAEWLLGNVPDGTGLAAVYRTLAAAFRASPPLVSAFVGEGGLTHVSSFFTSPVADTAAFQGVFALLTCVLGLPTSHHFVLAQFEDFTCIFTAAIQRYDLKADHTALLDFVAVVTETFRESTAGAHLPKLLVGITQKTRNEQNLLVALQLLSRVNVEALAPFADKIFDTVDEQSAGRAQVTALYLVLSVVSAQCVRSMSTVYSRAVQCMQAVIEGPVMPTGTDMLALCFEIVLRLTMLKARLCDMFSFGSTLPLLRTSLRMRVAEFLLHVLDIDTSKTAERLIEKQVPQAVLFAIANESSKTVTSRCRTWSQSSEQREALLDRLLLSRLNVLKKLRESCEHTLESFAAEHPWAADLYRAYTEKVFALEESFMQPAVLAIYEGELERGRAYVYDAQVIKESVDNAAEERRLARTRFAQDMHVLQFDEAGTDISVSHYSENATVASVMPVVSRAKYDRQNWALPRVMQDAYLERLHRAHKSKVVRLNVTTAHHLHVNINKSMQADKLENTLNVAAALLSSATSMAGEMCTQQKAQCELHGGTHHVQRIEELKEEKLKSFTNLHRSYKLARSNQMQTVDLLREEAASAMTQRHAEITTLLDHLEQEDTKARLRIKAVVDNITPQQEAECRGLSKRYRGDLGRLIAEHGIREQIGTRELVMEAEKEKKEDLLNRRSSAAAKFEAVLSTREQQELQRWVKKRLRAQSRDESLLTQASQYKANSAPSQIASALTAAVMRSDKSSISVEHVLRAFNKLCMEDEALQQRCTELCTSLPADCRASMRSAEEALTQELAAFVAEELRILTSQNPHSTWSQYLAEYHSRLAAMTANDTARRSAMYDDVATKATAECGVIEVRTLPTPLDHPLVISGVLPAWSLCRWVCTDGMRGELQAASVAYPSVHFNIEERVAIARGRGQQLTKVTDKVEFYILMLEWLEEERSIVLEAVHEAGEKDTDTLKVFMAVDGYFDTMCDLVGLVAWGSSAMLNDKLKGVRGLVLTGKSVHGCASSLGAERAMGLELQQAPEHTLQDFEQYKQAIEEMELEETSKAELEAVTLLRSENTDLKEALLKRLDTVVGKKRELQQLRADHIAVLTQLFKDSNNEANDAIMLLATMLDQSTLAAGSLAALQKTLEEEEEKTTCREAAFIAKVAELEDEQFAKGIDTQLEQLEEEEITIRKELASIHVESTHVTKDLDRYMLQRNESLTAARRSTQRTKQQYQAKKAELDRSIKALVDKVTGAVSCIPDIQLNSEHEGERAKLKKRLLRSQAADELLKEEAAGSFTRQRSLSILLPTDQLATARTLEAQLAERSNQRADRELRLAHRQKLEMKERAMLDDSRHLTELRRIETDRVNSLRKETQAARDIRDTCTIYTPEGSAKCDLTALGSLLEAQAAMRGQCAAIEDDTFAKKKEIISRMRVAVAPQVSEKLAMLLKSEESHLEDTKQRAAEQAQHDASLKERMATEPDFSILDIDAQYKQLQSMWKECEKLAAAERSALLDDARCAQEEATAGVHRELREMVINEVILEEQEDKQEEAFLAAQIAEAQQDPAKMEELIGAVNRIAKGENHYLYNTGALKQEYAEREQLKDKLLRRLVVEGDRLAKVKVFMKRGDVLSTKNAVSELEKVIQVAQRAMEQQHNEDEKQEAAARREAENRAEKVKAREQVKANATAKEVATVKPKPEPKPRHSAYSGDGEWMYNLEELDKEFQERKNIRKKEKEKSMARHREEKEEVIEQLAQIAAASASVKHLEAQESRVPPPLTLPDSAQAKTLAKQHAESMELAEMWDTKREADVTDAKAVSGACKTIAESREEVLRAVVAARGDAQQLCQREKEAIVQEINEVDSEAKLQARKEQYKDKPWMYDAKALDAEFQKREAEREVLVGMITDLHDRSGTQTEALLMTSEENAPHLELREVAEQQEDDLQVATAEAAKKQAAIDYEISQKALRAAEEHQEQEVITRLNSEMNFRKAAAELEAHTENVTRTWEPRLKNLVKLQVLMARYAPHERSALLEKVRDGNSLCEITVGESLPSASKTEAKKIAASFRLAKSEVLADADKRAQVIEEQASKVAADEQKALEKEKQRIKAKVAEGPRAVGAELRAADDGEWMYNLDTLEEDFKIREMQRKRKRSLAQARADRARDDGRAWVESTLYKGDWMYDVSALVEQEQQWEAHYLRGLGTDSPRRGQRESESEETEPSLHEIEEQEALIKQQRDTFEMELTQQHVDVAEHVKYLQQRSDGLHSFSWPPKMNKNIEAKAASTDRENAYHRLRRESRFFHLVKQYSLQKAKRRHKSRKGYCNLEGLIKRAQACDAAVAKHREHAGAAYPLQCYGGSDVNDLVSLHRRRLAANGKVLAAAVTDAARAWHEVDLRRLAILRETEEVLTHDDFELFTGLDLSVDAASRPATSTALLHFVAESCVACFTAAVEAVHKSCHLGLEVGTSEALLAALKMYEECMEHATESRSTLADIKAVLAAQSEACEHEVDTVLNEDAQQMYRDAVAMLAEVDAEHSQVPLGVRLVGHRGTLLDATPQEKSAALSDINDACIKMAANKVTHDVFATVAPEREQPELSEHQMSMIKLDACKSRVHFLSRLMSDTNADLFENTAGKLATRWCQRHETSAMFEKKVVRLKTEVSWYATDRSIRPVVELSMTNVAAPSMPPLLDRDSAVFYQVSVADTEKMVLGIMKDEAGRIQMELEGEWQARWSNDAAMADLGRASREAKACATKEAALARHRNRVEAARQLGSIGRCITAECHIRIAELCEESSEKASNALLTQTLAVQDEQICQWVAEVQCWGGIGIDTSDIYQVAPQHPGLNNRLWPGICIKLLDEVMSSKTEDELFEALRQIRFSLMTGAGTGYVFDAALHGADAMMRCFTARVMKARYTSVDVAPIITTWKGEVNTFGLDEQTCLAGAYRTTRWSCDALSEESALLPQHTSNFVFRDDPQHDKLVSDLYHHAAQDAPVLQYVEYSIYKTARQYFERLAANKLAITIAALESGWRNYVEGLAIKALTLVEQRALHHQSARAEHIDYGKVLHELGSTMEKHGQSHVRQLWSTGLTRFMAMDGVPNADGDAWLRHEVVEAIKGQLERGSSMWVRVKHLTADGLPECMPECLQNVTLPSALQEDHTRLIREVTPQGVSFDTLRLLQAHCDKEMFGSAVNALSHALVSPVSALHMLTTTAQYAVASVVLIVAASARRLSPTIDVAASRALTILWQLGYSNCVAEECQQRFADSATYVDSIWRGHIDELVAEEDDAWKEIESSAVRELAALTMAMEARYLKRLRLAQEAINEKEGQLRHSMATQHEWFAINFDEETERMAVAAQEELALYLILEFLEEAVERFVRDTLVNEHKLQTEEVLWHEANMRAGVSEEYELCFSELEMRCALEVEARRAWMLCTEQALRHHLEVLESSDWQDLVDVMLQGEGSAVIKNGERAGRLLIVQQEVVASSALSEQGALLKHRWLHDLTLQRLMSLTHESMRRMLYNKLRQYVVQRREHRERIRYQLERGLTEEEEAARMALATSEESKWKMMQKSEQHNRIMKNGYNQYKRKSSLVPLVSASPDARRASCTASPEARRGSSAASPISPSTEHSGGWFRRRLSTVLNDSSTWAASPKSLPGLSNESQSPKVNKRNSLPALSPARKASAPAAYNYWESYNTYVSEAKTGRASPAKQTRVKNWFQK